MTYVPQSYYNAELYHHGILGQKWGERNGPPYPLKPSDHSKDEQKAGYKKSINKGSLTPSKKHENSNKNKTNKVLSRIGDKTMGEIDPAIKQLGMDAAGIAIITLLASVRAAVHNKISIKKHIEELEQRKNNRSIKHLDDIPKIEGDNTPTSNMSVTNKDFGKPGRSVNCTLCTTAMAMREMGYDVIAGASNHGYGPEIFNKAFNAPDGKLRGSNKKKLETLSKLPEGSFGNLGLYWKQGGGHSIFFKIEHGKPVFYDGQGNVKYKTSDLLREANLSMYNRLDNCKPTEYALGLVELRKE